MKLDEFNKWATKQITEENFQAETKPNSQLHRSEIREMYLQWVHLQYTKKAGELLRVIK